MADIQAPHAGSPDVAGTQHPLVKFWWVFPSLLAAAAVVAGLLNREQTLNEQEIAPPVLQTLQGLSQKSMPSTQWHEMAINSSVIRNSGPEGRVEVRVKTRLERIHDLGIIRRSDDWYELQGQRPLFEERSLSWNGLWSLARNERDPAPIVHDILANQGWRKQRTQTLSIDAQPGFPLREGSAIRATSTRTRQRHDDVTQPAVHLWREVVCARSGDFAAGEIFKDWAKPLPRVVCKAQERKFETPSANGAPGRIVRQSSTDYAYLADHDLFLAVSWTETDQESASPLSDRPPPEIATRIRIESVQVTAGQAR